MTALNRFLLLRLLPLWAMLCMSFSVFAAIPLSDGWKSANDYVSRDKTFYSADEACNAALAGYPNKDTAAFVYYLKPYQIIVDGTQLKCTIIQAPKNAPDNPWLERNPIFVKSAGSCPANSTLTNGACVCKDPYQEQGGQCVLDSVCQARNDAPVANFTVGWAYADFSTTDLDKHFTKSNFVGGKTFMPPRSGSVCVTGCRADINADNPYSGGTYSSTVPSSNGLYRQSVEVNVHYSGATCSQEESDNDISRAFEPSTPDQKCDGQQGTIQLGGAPAKAVCLPSSGTPGAGEQLPEKLPTPLQNGNPAAGNKPTTGEGSGFGGDGRTPSTGGGGNKGGPRASTKPGGGDGTGTGGEGGEGGEGEDDEKKEGCGSAEKPCKIDETGTGDGEGAFEEAHKQLNDADKERKDALDAIKGKDDKDTSWGTTFGWLQHGGCAPWTLGKLPPPMNASIDIDICTIEQYTSPIVSFLWVITTLGMCAGLVFSAMAGGKQ